MNQMDTEVCQCGCGEAMPDDARYGAAFKNRAHKNRAYRQRKALSQNKMYMKIDSKNLIVSIPANRVVTEQCINCPSLMLIDCGIASKRKIRFCPDCTTVSRRRI